MTRLIVSWSVLCVTVLGIGVVQTSVLRTAAHANDFAHYYVTSRLWLDGQDPYRADFAVEFQKYHFEFDPQIPTAGNAPPLVIAFAPFASLNPRAGFVAWVCLEGLSIAFTLWATLHVLEVRPSSAALPLLAASFVSARATVAHFLYSQTQLLVGALLLAAFLLHRRRRFAAAWLSASTAAALKLFPGLLLPWFIITADGTVRQKIRWALPSGLLAILLVAGAPALWSGFFHSGLGTIANNVPGRGFDYSLPSFIVRIGWMIFDAAPTPQQVRGIWDVAIAGSAAIAISAYLIWWTRRLSGERAFCLLLLCSIMASPTAWGHYFVLAFFPFAVFAVTLLHDRSAFRIGVVVVTYCFVLFLLPLGTWLPSNGVARLLLEYCPMYACFGLIAWFAVNVDASKLSRPAHPFRSLAELRIPRAQP